MAYVALYRKFRPQKFDELVGQEHIVRTLLNQLEGGRIAHAYLFAGPRGTGKTSTAKLFARAINCAKPVNGNPCGECDSCKSSSADDNMDITEIDAASNNGVDNIRDIRDKVMFAPAYGKYRVYIIDEVHMLSPGAFNALLKTLEEPPKHVVFILATTELHKLPATILSRCQRFDFKLITSGVIAQRLTTVLTEVGAAFEKEAIELIAKSASGGMRDALSLADVCLSYCGANVTLKDAMNILGISDRAYVFDFADALIKGDAGLALKMCREAESRDVGVLVLEMMEHFRDLLLCSYSPDCEEIAILPRETQKRLAEQAKGANTQRILRAIEIFSRLEGELKLHSRKDIELQTAAVRICMPELEGDLTALEDRVARLEKALAEGSICVSTRAVQGAEAKDAPPWEEATHTPIQPSISQKAAGDEKPQANTAKTSTNVEKPQAIANSADLNWQNAMEKLKQVNAPLQIMIRGLDAVLDGNTLTIYIPENARSREGLIQKNMSLITQVLSDEYGKAITVNTKIGKRESGENKMMQAALDLFS